MSVLTAVLAILSKAEGPLHYKEITRRIVDEGLWKPGGKTPAATVNSQIAVNIKKKGESSKFIRVGEGTFYLRAKSTGAHFIPTVSASSSISFTDAAEKILEGEANQRPMHYRDITTRALKAGLIRTAGHTPAATMYSQILTEISRHSKQGKQPRFMKYGKGLVGLSKWFGKGLAFQIEQQNRNAAKKLLERVKKLEPMEFEELVVKVLGVIGFEIVSFNSKHGKDGGIDVRGRILSGGVIQTNIAVQAKKWKGNVQAPVIQQVRGSIGPDEQGLVITTSDFSAGAKKEALRKGFAPVWLMNGEQFVELMIENEIGVTRSSHNIIEIGDTEEGE